MNSIRENLSENYIEHNGILGMKWGVRNGPPYPLDVKDHSKSEVDAGYKKSLHGQKNEHLYSIKKKKTSNFKEKRVNDLSNSYKKDLKVSDEEARRLADEHYEKMKKVAIAAGVTVGAVALTATAMYIGKNYINYTIKNGTTLQTLANDPERMNAGTHFFTTFLDKDKNSYQGLFGGETKLQLLNTVQDDMRIANRHEANKIFNQKIKNNKNLINDIKKKLPDLDTNNADFKLALNDALYGKKSQNLKSKADKFRKRHMSNSELFNYSIFKESDPNESEVYRQARKAINEVYIDELTRRGFDGVIDINDANISKLVRTYKPTIITNRNKLGETVVNNAKYQNLITKAQEKGLVETEQILKGHQKKYYNTLKLKGTADSTVKHIVDAYGNHPVRATSAAAAASSAGLLSSSNKQRETSYVSKIPAQKRQKAYNLKRIEGMTPQKMAREANIPLAIAKEIMD